MRYIQVVEQQNSILKNITVDDICYITNSYIYFLTNRNSRVTNSMSDIISRLRAVEGRWIGWSETTNNFLHIGTIPIIVIPEAIKDIVGSQIRFKNLQTIVVDESFQTIISMIPPEAPPPSPGGTYVGSQYIDISSNNVISAVTSDIDNIMQPGLVLNSDAYTHLQEITTQISNLGNHANLSNLDYDNSGHIGFQKALTSVNAGSGITITTGPNNEVLISASTAPGTTNHASLSNLDYANSGHIGFQKALTSANAGAGISITIGSDNEVLISASIAWGQITGTLSSQTDLNNRFGSIEELIPVQATSSNQLADKDFVNSSIATSTATFRETYNVVTDLHLSTSATHQQVATALGNTISVADNNDYCFVEIPTDDLTPTETLQVDRYKYNGTSWSFEYTLNNSGYTAEQWASINSGITSGKVTQYDDYATSKQDTLTAGSGISLQNGNINTQNIIWRTW